MKIPAGVDDELVDSDDEDVRIPSNKIGEKSGAKDKPILSFTPQQAHIFGGQSIFLSFVDIDAPLNKDVFYYVIFKGSKMQHITSAKVLNPYTLQAVIPDHNDAELVILSVCQYASDSTDLYPDNNVMATDTFVYTSDSSQFLTQQLASNADDPCNLLNLQNVYSSLLDISLKDRESLDYKLTTSFRNLLLPSNWSLTPTTKKEDEKSWTLLHFCAKYNFPMLAEYLLIKSGAKDALKTLDERNHTPIDIAKFTKHKKMIEVLSRSPCEEEVNTGVKKELKRPNVKRHKLGTTTYTNEVSGDKAVTVKDLMTFKELDTLATTSKGSGTTEITDEHYPLAESLRKLHEINEEIRRLRSITKDISDTLDTDDCYETENDTLDMCNGERFIDKNRNDYLLSVVNSEVQEEVDVNDSLNDNSSENSTEIQLITENNTNPIDIEDINFNIVDKHDNYCHKPESSNGSPVTFENLVTKNEPEEFAPVVCTESENVKPPENGTNNSEQCVQSTDINNAGELSSKLESVTEETEEELNVDIQRRRKLSKGIKKHVKNAEDKSLFELPPAPKRVGILRRSGKKKDNRPWSDSFENIRKVDNEGIEYYKSDVDICDGYKFSRGHSLDALLDNTLHSTTSGNDHLGSLESLSSDSENHRTCLSSDSGSSHFQRQRYDSDKSIGSQRSLSLLSLNEIPKKSRFHRWSFKAKSKSMTSLEMEENGKIVEDRRQTIPAIDNLKFSKVRIEQNAHKDQNYNVTQQDIMYGDILVRCGPYDGQLGLNAESPPDKTSKEADRSSYHSDEETDEGISREIGEQSAFERKSSASEKQKRRFGILRGSSKVKDKERKGSKEKKDIRDRKDSDGKINKKKLPSNKQDAVINNKLDSKSGFLSQRGSSFRKQGDSKVIDKSALVKSSAIVTSNPFSNRRSTQERKSPSVSRKFSPQTDFADVYDSSTLLQSNNLSSSRTSLDSYDDDTDAPFTSLEEEYDSDIDNPEEPETWSVLVDKNVQRKMHTKEIKKQDVIYELIQTESLYLKTLQIMKKIYANGMIRCLNYEAEVVNSLFPVLDDLIDLNGNFYRAMKKEQEESIHYCIENIGDVILKTFDGENGQLFKKNYGYFCSHHLEAVAIYKELLKSSKRFNKFVTSCLVNERTRRLSIQECITYVTIRITKYPLLIEAIIKATKESSPDCEKLKKSLNLIKEILVSVDEDVETHAQEKELDNLKRMLDRKNVVEIKHEANKGIITKYKANKLFHKRSRLLYDKKVTLKSKNNKYYETRMIILADKIIFFQENGGKLQLLNVDNKMPVMFLKGVMVRTVATDINALFLMNTSKESVEIYEIGFDKGKEKKEFMSKIEKFIANCPDEEEENLTDNEEEARREEEDRMLKLREFVDQLEITNEKIAQNLEGKNKIVLELRKLLESMEEDSPVKGSPCMELKPVDIFNARAHLEDCLSKVNNALLSNVNDTPAQSIRQISNTNNFHAAKKSDTFSGYERTKSVGNISRSGSSNQIARRDLDVVPTVKHRRPSQIMNVLSRTKTMGSTEDLSSLSSSGSSTSISNIHVPALSQVQVYQQLSERLGTLVDVTNKQDLELAKMRNKLQESRDLQAKTESDLAELRGKLILQQKESERHLRDEKDNFAKLSREFKRSKEKINQSWLDHNNAK